EQGPPAVHAGVPVEAAEKNRMQGAGPLHIGGTFEHVIQLVGVFARHMTQGGAGIQGGDVWGEGGHQKRKANRYIRTILIPSMIRPVGIWARITPFSGESRSGSSSRLAGTTLKLAAIGVISVPQKPASMPMAQTMATLPSN